MEPLLNYDESGISKYITFPPPAEFISIWDAYIQHESNTWVHTEVDLSEDISQWKDLDEDMKFYLKRILAFFAASDGIILENLCTRFLNEFENPWVQKFYRSQARIEDVHANVYGMFIDEYIEDREEQLHLCNAIDEIPSIKNKADWAIKWIASDDSLGTRLVAFACVEGIFFYGSFASIYWLREKKNILPGLCTANNWIARDEGMHRDFAVLLYRDFVKGKLSTEQVHTIIKAAVDLEIEFVCEAVPCTLVGMKKDDMAEYIRFVANQLSSDLGHGNIYANTACPFPFMMNQNFETKANFFERTVTDYRKVMIKDRTKDNLSTLSFTEDF